MSNPELYKQIENLPDHLKKEVSDFVNFLLAASKPAVPVKRNSTGKTKSYFRLITDFDEH